MKRNSASLIACLLLLLPLLVASTPIAAQVESVFSGLVLSSADNAVENSWASKAPMQEARAHLGVAVVNGKIYAIGGDAGEISGNAIDE